MRPTGLAWLLGSGLLLHASTAAAADLGVRGGYYTRMDDPFAGAELVMHVSDRLCLDPNAEYVFSDGQEYYTVNADLLYQFPSRTTTFLWLGGGLATVSNSPGADPLRKEYHQGHTHERDEMT